MCQAHIKLWLGIVFRGLGFGMGWFGIRLKLNYQVSLLSLGGGGLNPAWAELGNNNNHD